MRVILNLDTEVLESLEILASQSKRSRKSFMEYVLINASKGEQPQLTISDVTVDFEKRKPSTLKITPSVTKKYADLLSKVNENEIPRLEGESYIDYQLRKQGIDPSTVKEEKKK